MSDQFLTLTQRPDHVARVGETIVIDGTPHVVKGVKPKREAGVFLDFGRNVEFNVVELTVERFDGYPS